VLVNKRGIVLARPIILIPHLPRLADAINFRKDYSPPLVRHLDPTVSSISMASGTQIVSLPFTFH
jgi:hypothetical protein